MRPRSHDQYKAEFALWIPRRSVANNHRNFVTVRNGMSYCKICKNLLRMVIWHFIAGVQAKEYEKNKRLVYTVSCFIKFLRKKWFALPVRFFYAILLFRDKEKDNWADKVRIRKQFVSLQFTVCQFFYFFNTFEELSSIAFEDSIKIQWKFNENWQLYLRTLQLKSIA